LIFNLLLVKHYQFIVFALVYYLFLYLFFFFNDTATTEIYTLSLHDALPIYSIEPRDWARSSGGRTSHSTCSSGGLRPPSLSEAGDRKSTRLNSSHVKISYAVFCLKKKKKKKQKAL